MCDEGGALTMAAKRLPAGIVLDDRGRGRCWWGASHPDYAAYHDEEWGFPVVDDVRLFEKICLEGFQSGLSWLTILRKRENFRRAFAGFDIDRISRFRPGKVEKLLQDASIVRHRGKIESVINNARQARALRKEVGSLASFFWSCEPDAASRPKRVTKAKLMKLSLTAESKALAKELKRSGWRYVGPTTVYAFMQAMRLVNDHLEGCFVREKAERARRRLKRPV